MSAQDRPSPDARICSNCRFYTFMPGANARCADARDRTINPAGSCEKFQISFASAKLLAFRDGASTRPEAWELAMHRHLAPGSGARS
jgi:hypothetical protein